MSNKNRKHHKNVSTKKASPKIGRKSIFLVVFLTAVVLAISLCIFFLVMHLRYNGWKTLTPDKEQGIYADQIELTYFLKKNGIRGKTELGAVEDIFNEKIREAYLALSADEPVVGSANLHTLSHSQNNLYTVSPLLYSTLKTMTEDGNRYLYYAPIIQMYETAFVANDDTTAKKSDPHHNPELQKAINRLLPYILSKEHIRIEFLKDELKAWRSLKER